MTVLNVILQDPKASRQSASLVSREAATAELDRETSNSSASREESLEDVGKVVWQSGFLLADYLIRKPPFGEWAGVRVIDLGAGTGRSFQYLTYKQEGLAVSCYS